MDFIMFAALSHATIAIGPSIVGALGAKGVAKVLPNGTKSLVKAIDRMVTHR